MRIVLLAIANFLCLTAAIAQSDTLYSRTDTVLCVEQTLQPVLFDLGGDTSRYRYQWLAIDSTVLDTLQQRLLEGTDTLVIVASPVDTLDPLIVDTLAYAIRYTPLPELLVPDIECYDGSPVFIEDDTSYDTLWTLRAASGNPTVDVDLSSQNIAVEIGNGDSSSVIITYDTKGCTSVADTVLVASAFTPFVDYSFTAQCFGDSTTIVNQSLSTDTSRFSLSVDGALVQTTGEDFKYFVPTNGGSSRLDIEVANGQCVDRDTLTITSLLQPTAQFIPQKTCENERLILSNLSQDQSSTAQVSIAVNGLSTTRMASPTITLADTLPDGIIPMEIILSNQNGCSDTASLSVTIDSATYVSYDGLDDTYCAMQDTATLVASVSAGAFAGRELSEDSPGRTLYIPTQADSNVLITFTYTNQLGCTDTYSDQVTIVHPKPTVSQMGLLDAYCFGDPSSSVVIDQSTGSSEYAVSRNGVLWDQGDDFSYVFDPIEVGVYNVLNVYTDNNGCFTETQSQTVVNPLPEVDLGSVVPVLNPGGVVVLHEGAIPDPDVIYEWSTGAMSTTTSVSLPGLYALSAINTLTGCTNSDTLEVVLSQVDTVDLVTFTFGPNPTSDIITLRSSEDIIGLQLIDLSSGSMVPVQGSSVFDLVADDPLIIDLAFAEPGYYCLIIPQVGSFLVVKI